MMKKTFVKFLEELHELMERGELFAPDIDVPPCFGETGLVKSMCLLVAEDCNLRCKYCFAGTGDMGHDRRLMTKEVGKAAVDYIIAHSGKRKHCEIDFFGGEPLVNMPVVKYVTEYVRQKEKETGKVFKLTLTTNGVLLNDENKSIEEIMKEDFQYVYTHTDQEEVVNIFRKYDLVVLPVLDDEKMLVGIVTVDDVMDVMVDETSEDISKMAAVEPHDKSYFETSVFEHAKHRIIWLLVLMFSATLTGSIITRYENAFQAVPLLVSFIPMLMDTGGNCGSQSSTLIIRGIALNEIRFKEIFKVMFKEFRIALVVGVILAIANGLRIYVMYQDINIAFVIALSLIVTVILSKLIGCILPLVANQIGLDPAIMASPLITTIVDTCSILVYFNIAVHIFNL